VSAESARILGLPALEKSPVFAAFSGDVLETLFNAGSPQTLEPGETLCQAGDAADAAYAVLSGEIEVRISNRQGGEVRIASLHEGAMVGEMAVLDGGRRSADMVALRRTTLWRIPRAALMSALAADPKAALAVIAELSSRLRSVNLSMDQTVRLDVGGQLALLLLEERNSQGLVALSQTELARRLSFSRETVNRKLRRWVATGCIEATAAGIRIISEAKLRAEIDL